MKLKHIFRVLIVSFIVFLVVEFVPFQSLGKGTVYDSVVGSKFRVVSVDGSPPERLKHGFIISIVPLVVIKAGAREIELKRENEHSDSSEETESFLIQSEVKSGERYKIIEVDGKPQIIKKDEM